MNNVARLLACSLVGLAFAGCGTSSSSDEDVGQSDDAIFSGPGVCIYGNGLYCGQNGVPGYEDHLYRCEGGTAHRVDVCDHGCASEGPGVNDHCRQNDVERALDYGRRVVGTRYGWWFGGPIPAGAPMYAGNGPAPAPAFVRSHSVNCAGLMNLLLRSVGKNPPGAGGTGSYGEVYARVAHKFDHSRASYPAGTLIGRYYRNVQDQGHVAVVLPNGHVLQSYANAYGGSQPGANARWTLAESDAGGFYEYYVLPEDWLGN